MLLQDTLRDYEQFAELAVHTLECLARIPGVGLVFAYGYVFGTVQQYVAGHKYRVVK